ncbi:cell division protein ZapA [Siculibacillus lacustris]|uniref:Cell division protein ZapA n=1 Tax=Siculibacillus lacustris TaxID=1549641 RepID=A0A4Q9VKS1_9HYPH|nr:cell division protein ZapA [Siculibacillus lacustris]TBW35921.1 cell division protein ZapA [Siculibacillus lacustris]
MSQVSVTINGRVYRMACEDGQEAHLQGLAQKLDDLIHTLRGSFGEIGDQRLTVMAAVMTMDEQDELQRKIRSLEAENRSLRETGAAAVERREALEAEMVQRVDEAARRIEALAGVLATRRT